MEMDSPIKFLIAVEKEIIYLSNEGLYVYDEKTGKEIWKKEADLPPRMTLNLPKKYNDKIYYYYIGDDENKLINSYYKLDYNTMAIEEISLIHEKFYTF